MTRTRASHHHDQSFRVRIRTPSRLHFGLLGWGQQAVRQFGGVGLMIDSPGIELTAEPAPSGSPRAAGPAGRADHRTASGRGCIEAGITPATGSDPRRECSGRARRARRRHAALAGGCSRGLETRRAAPDVTLLELARLTGRGGRSGIGLHGILSRRPDRRRRPKARGRNPSPSHAIGVSRRVVDPDRAATEESAACTGLTRTRAFAELPPIAQSVTDVALPPRAARDLPAVIEHDLKAFGAASSELQERVGAAFAPAQGGIYATPQAAAIVQRAEKPRLRGRGPELVGTDSVRLHRRPEPRSTAWLSNSCWRSALDRVVRLLDQGANQGAVVRGQVS